MGFGSNVMATRWWIGPAMAGCLGVGAAIGAGAVAWSANDVPASSGVLSEPSQIFRQLETFADVLARVQTDYVTETKDSDLIDSAINGMLSSLDPHSSYMNADAFKDMQVQTKGEYGGLGIEVTMTDGVLTVVSPIDDTPASRAGILSGDKLTAIDGAALIGMSLTDAVKKMRGAVGTPITITIAREGKDPFPLTLTREVVTVKSVTHKIKDEFGYIRITTFINENTANDAAKAVQDIQRQLGGRLKGIVLDLRNNPGGLLDQSIDVSSLFLDGGEVVSTRGRRAEDIQRYNARAGVALKNVPLVVLVNQGSASAAEIVAGAIKDRKRGIIVGMDTFGKGSVQSVIPLSGGREGGLRLTTAKYYTPSGRSIQGSGIEPDVEIASIRVTVDDVAKAREAFRGEEDLPHALGNDDGAKRREVHLPPDMPPIGWKETEDYQLKRAYEILRDGPPKVTAVAAAAQAVEEAAKAPTGKESR